MTSKTEAGTTPANVAAQATTSGVLDRNDLALIGLFGQAGDLRALVRLPNGRIETVQTGAKLASGRIVGIDENGMMIQKNGKAQRIAIPGD